MLTPPDDEEPSTKPNTTTTLPPTFDNGELYATESQLCNNNITTTHFGSKFICEISGCEPQIDEVWTLNWPNTAQGDIASIPCGLDNKGISLHIAII